MSVRDTGVASPPKSCPRDIRALYKSDAARRSPGSGLGLAIAKHIVLAHSGTIWAVSSSRGGATVLIHRALATPSVIAPSAHH